MKGTRSFKTYWFVWGSSTTDLSDSKAYFYSMVVF